MASKIGCPKNLTVHTFNYSHKCFPRCNRLVKISNCCFPPGHRVDVVCRSDYEVDKRGFALETDYKGNQALPSNDLNPAVVVCILQCDEKGILTKQDRNCVQYFRRYIDNPADTTRGSLGEEKAVFVIENKLTITQLCIVSGDIAEEMKSKKSDNDVFHRLFLYPSDEIGIRISLLLEKHTIGREESLRSEEREKFMAKNKIDLQYHQSKIVSLRNTLIYEFGFEGDKLIASIEDFSKRDEVRNYLQKFLKNAANIDIIQFEEMVVNYLSLKSGDKVTCSKSECFGTVGLILKDEFRFYCTTCKHVINDCLGSSNATSTHQSKCKSFTITTQHAHFKTDLIFTPSKDFDFSAIRLVQSENDTKTSSGLRRKDGDFVNGSVLSNDIPTLPPGTELYKWGAKSGLTVGIFKGMLEETCTRIFVKIEGSNFAQKGDSGSLICYSDTKHEMAAMILIGRLEKNENVYVCHKLTDALVSLNSILKHDTTLKLS